MSVTYALGVKVVHSGCFDFGGHTFKKLIDLVQTVDPAPLHITQVTEPDQPAKTT
jgi:hypothetical protein